jgi:hypothetical protein
VSKRCDRELIERQHARVLNKGFGDTIDVHAIAGEVDDQARNGSVRNPNGVLIHRVTKRLHEAADRRAAAAQRREANERRYARLHAEVLRVAVEHRSGPATVAALLRAARQSGFPLLNPYTAEELDRIAEQNGGDRWEPEPSPELVESFTRDLAALETPEPEEPSEDVPAEDQEPHEHGGDDDAGAHAEAG